MNSIALARSHIRQAEERIKHAREALESGNYPYVVRQCQEAVELCLKAALRLVGVEPPKWHDVGPILRREAHRFPTWFQEKIDLLASILEVFVKSVSLQCMVMKSLEYHLKSFILGLTLSKHCLKL